MPWKLVSGEAAGTRRRKPSGHFSLVCGKSVLTSRPFRPILSRMATNSAKPARPPDRQRVLAHPHDLLVRHFLADTELAADLLRNHLDRNVADLLDLEHLQCESPGAVDRDLAESLGDLRFSTRFLDGGKRAEVLIFVEHQSTPDRFIRIRVVEYIAKAYRIRLLEGKKGKGVPKTLPGVVAVVLYNGKKPWRKIPKIRDLVDGFPREWDMSHYLEYPLFLIDLAAMPEREAAEKGKPAVRALLSALQAAPRGRLASRFGQIAGMLAKAKGDPRVRDWLIAISRYASFHCRPERGREAILNAWRSVMGKKEGEKMAATLAEELIKEGMVRGKAEGKAEGRAEGKAEGRAEGKAEGRAEGKAEAVAGILKVRFGSVPTDIRKSVLSRTDPSALESLTVQAVTCKTLADFRRTLR